MPLWLRYVDDTFAFIKEEYITEVINVLNCFHPVINFTRGVEENNCTSFLDVRVIRNENGLLSREVFRKDTDTNLYLHWKSFAPDIWKIGTLKGLSKRAFLVCSDKTSLEKEIKHLKFVFTKINKYSLKIVYKTLREVRDKFETGVSNDFMRGQNKDNNTEIPDVFPHIVLPYKGKEGHKMVQALKKYFARVLPSNIGKYLNSRLFP